MHTRSIEKRVSTLYEALDASDKFLACVENTLECDVC